MPRTVRLGSDEADDRITREYTGRRAGPVRNAIELRLDLEEFVRARDLRILGRGLELEGDLVEYAEEGPVPVLGERGGPQRRHFRGNPFLGNAEYLKLGTYACRQGARELWKGPLRKNDGHKSSLVDAHDETALGHFDRFE
jgi:hypothetical protein